MAVLSTFQGAVAAAAAWLWARMPRPLQRVLAALWVRIYVGLWQADCLVAGVATGVRNKSISAWLGQCKANRYGPIWKVLSWPAFWVVEDVGEVLGDPDHCEEAAVPYEAVINSE